MSKKPQAITIGQDFITKKLYMMNEAWPNLISVTPNLLEAELQCLVLHLTFTLENGTAKYVVTGKDLHGNLICRRISSTYKKQPWP